MKCSFYKSSITKKYLSLLLVMALVYSSVQGAFVTAFADDYVVKKRFLVVYKNKQSDDKKSLQAVRVSSKLKNGEVISIGKESIALLEDTRLGISSTFRDADILAVEEDNVVSLLDEVEKNNDATTPKKDKADELTKDDKKSKNSKKADAEKSDAKADEKATVDKAKSDNATEKSSKAKLTEKDKQAKTNEVETGDKKVVKKDKTRQVKASKNPAITDALSKYITKSKGQNVKIALIDSGVNTANSSAIQLAGGASFIDNKFNSDENGHGTSLAGLIKGYRLENGAKFQGIAPDAELYSLKVLDKNGHGYYSDVIKALEWSRRNNMDVVIMAFGGDKYSSILHRSLQKNYFQDMLLISASGNDNGRVKYPSAYSEVMSVGSSYQDSSVLYNYQNQDIVEIYAEGKNIPTINALHDKVLVSGSSYSSAIVGAASACIWSQDNKLNARQVRGVIKKASKKLTINTQKYNILDVVQAGEIVAKGDIPQEIDYDSEIKDEKPNEDTAVTALADITMPPSNSAMWNGFTVGVKFSHNHSKVKAVLVKLNEDGSEKEIQTVERFDIKGEFVEPNPEKPNEPSGYLGEEYNFDYSPTYLKGKYRIDFYPYEEDDETVLMTDWLFSTDEFYVQGADLKVNKFVLTSTDDVVLGKESLQGYAEIQNVEQNYYADYPADVVVDFYRVKDNQNSFINPTADTIETYPLAHKIASKVVSKDELQSKKVAVVDFAWKPQTKEEVQNYKIYAVIKYNKKYDDVSANNIRKLPCDATVTFLLKDGTKLTQCFGGDPVNLSSGNYTSTTTDMAIAGKVPLEFNRVYNGLDFKNHGLGLHFRHNYNVYYEDNQDYLKVYFNDGHIEFFEKKDAGYSYNKSDYQFVGFENGKFKIKYKNNKTYLFGDNKHIESITEKGKVVNFKYESFADNDYYNGQKTKTRLTEIYSESGRIVLTYNTANKLISLTDNAGRTVKYSYDGKYLVSTTNISGNKYSYHYDKAGRLNKLIDPYGNNQLENIYDKEGRVVHQTNEDGTFYEFEYYRYKTIFTEKDGTKITYYKDEKDRIIKKEYPNSTERFVFDENDNVIRYFDKNGNESNFEYDLAGNLTVSKDALGQITKYIYNQNCDLIEKENPDGSKVHFEYDENSNIIKLTDGLGQVQTFKYDNLNNLVQAVRKDGAKLTFTYDERGNLQTESLDGVKLKTYKYDLVNRVVKKIDALGRETEFVYSPNGSIVSTISPNGVVIKNVYDKEARLVEKIDANGNSTKYQYNNMGSLTKMINADNTETGYTYDNMQNLIIVRFADGTAVKNIYDKSNRLIKQIDENGNAKTYTYDNNNNILTTTDELGRVTSFAYDKLNRLIKTVNPLGDISTLSYRYDNKVVSETDFAGRMTKYDYDVLGRLIKVTTPDGKSSKIKYDSLDNIITSIDKLARATNYTYDKRSNLVSVTLPDGSTLKNEYDLNNNLIKQIDAARNETTYQYDENNRLIKKVNALGKTISLEYDKNGNLVKTTNEKGSITARVYNSMNKVVEIKDCLAQVQKVEYDKLGRIVKHINKDGSFNTLSYDKKGRLISATDELGNMTKYAYDKVNNVIQFTDKEGNITSSVYDKLNRLVKVTDPLGNEVLTDYDKSGNVLSVTNALGDKHSYEYDIMGNVVKEISPNQAVKKLKYNVMSKLVELEDEQNNKTAYAYDKLDRLVKVTFADGTFQKQSYDKNSNIIATENVLGGKKVYTYDALNRLVSQTDEEGITNKLTYTATSQLASTIDGKGNVTSYQYDGLDRLVTEINAQNIATNYVYDARDNIVKILTKSGLTNEMVQKLANKENHTAGLSEEEELFEYDKANNLIKEVAKSGYLKTYQYNKNGKLQSVVDEDGFKTNYKYDKNSNLIEKTITGGLLAKQQNSKVNYQYDQLNRLIKRVDNLYQKNAGSQPKVYSYSYDQQGNLLSEKDFEGKVTKLSYDKLNNLTELTYPDNTVVNYTYDSMNRLQTVRDRKGTSRYSYDKLGRRVKLDFANGTTEAYSYDKKGRILTQLSRDKFNKKMAYHRYEYDKNDNITIDEFKDYNGFLSKDVSIKSYGYDKLNQLTFDKVAKSHNCKFGSERRYYYDVAGNRVQIAETNQPTRAEQFLDVKPQVYITDYQYGKDNQLLKQRGDNKAIAHHKSVAFDFEYDKRGNLTAVKDPWLKTDSKYVAQYYYDGTNKLRYSTDKQNALTKYSYDGFGRRIAKESESNLNLSVTAKRIASQNGEKITEQIANRNGCFQVITTENYVYNPVSEYDDVLLRYGKNVKTERFVYGAKDRDNGLLKKESFAVSAKSWDNKTEPNTCTAKEVLSRQNNFATRYLTKDIRGSIENQSDEYGIKTACYKYTAFGVAKTIMDLDEVHGYAGYIRDRETNTYYVNARQYMPQTARFMAKDKLRVDSLNRYLYVVNNPVNMVDPSGMIGFKIPDNVKRCLRKAKKVIVVVAKETVEVAKDTKDIAVGVVAGAAESFTDIPGDIAIGGVYAYSTFVCLFNGEDISDKVHNSKIYQGVEGLSEFKKEFVDETLQPIISSNKVYSGGKFGGKVAVMLWGTGKFTQSGKVVSSTGKVIRQGESIMFSLRTLSNGSVAAGTAFEVQTVVIDAAVVEAFLDSMVGIAAIKSGLTGVGKSGDCGEKGDCVSKYKNTKDAAEKIAKKYNGVMDETKNKNGYKVVFKKGKKEILVRFMGKGSGKRTGDYFRVSVLRKGTLTAEGSYSSERALTHIDLNDGYIELIEKMLRRFD